MIPRSGGIPLVVVISLKCGGRPADVPEWRGIGAHFSAGALQVPPVSRLLRTCQTCDTLRFRAGSEPIMRDYDVRVALRERLIAEHGADPDTLIVEELGLHEGAVRADVAVINGAIHGFEIKSERDTLERLPRQRDAYERCFDRVTLVVAMKHRRKAEAVIPKGWGILVATAREGRVELVVAREPRPNNSVAPESVVQLLWRDEAVAILRRLGVGKGLHTKRRRELWGLLVASVPLDELRRLVRETLKARRDWRAEKRQAPDSGSSPTAATPLDLQANLDWLLAAGSRRPPG
jgi:hypothetical protein